MYCITANCLLKMGTKLLFFEHETHKTIAHIPLSIPSKSAHIGSRNPSNIVTDTYGVPLKTETEV